MMATEMELLTELKAFAAMQSEFEVSPDEPWRVLILNDDAALSRLLASELGTDYDVVGVCDETGDAMLLAIEKQPDAAIVSCTIPGMPAETVAGWIREVSPHVRIVAVTDGGNSDLVWADAHLERLHVDNVKHALEGLLR